MDTRTAPIVFPRTQSPTASRPRRRWTTAVLLGVALWPAVALADSTASDPEPCEGDCSAPVPYRHPLQGSQPVHGLFPGVDLHNAPNGGRYVVFDRQVVAGEGEATRAESGVEVVERRPVTASERRELDAANPKIPQVLPAKFSPQIARKIAESPANELVDLVVTIDRGDVMLLDQAMDRAIAGGEIATREDYEVKRLELLALRSRQIAAAQDPVVEAIEDLGGEVLTRCRNLSCLLVRMTAGSVPELDRVRGLRQVELDVGLESNGAGATSRAGHQITHVVADFDGEGPTYAANDTIWGGMIETCRVRETHYSFHDWSSTSSNRYFLYDCSSGTCSWQTITGDPCGHATAVASAMFGDTEDGQIAGVTGVSGAGMAPEANAYLYRVGSLGNMVLAWDHLTTRANKVQATNMSISLENHPPYNCSGTDGTSFLADELYEAGILLVMAAGNDGGSSSQCRVEIPGSALTVFTIGGHGSAGVGCGYDEDDVRTGDIHPSSAWGGNLGGDFSAQGRGRRILDLTTNYYIGGRASASGDTAFSGCSAGTSLSAPQATGAALDFADFYKQEISNFIDHPGSLTTNMLIQGDRAMPGGGKRSWGFDRRFGAGRLKMRRFDSVGMDGPWYYYNGSVCVGDDEVVSLHLNNGNAFPQDFDDLKAVIWWYDPGYRSGQTLDDIELHLRTTSNTLLRYSASSYANKEMVQYTDIGGHNVRLNIVGDRVTADNVGCGNNSMRVFFTVYAEDGDREPAENLSDVERM